MHFNTKRITCTRCGYEVQGMVLLLDLNGATRLDLSNDTSVHVLTFTNYDFNGMAPVIWKL
jgi:hypothetical protein